MTSARKHFETNFFNLQIFLTPTLLALPMSFVFPETSRSNYNPNDRQIAHESTPSEIISHRPTSDFNRLVFTRIGHSLPVNDDYIEYNDEPEKLTNSLSPNGEQNEAVTTTKSGGDQLVFHASEDTQSRHFIKFKHKKKRMKKKRRPCIPQAHRPSKYGSRTYPNLNVVFVDVNYNGDYNTVGGYACRPGNYGSAGAASHAGGLFNHGAHGGYDSVEADEEDYDDAVVEPDTVVNSHGSLLTIGDGGGSVGGGGGGGGAAAQGGPLGFFGQGGLFDFSGHSSGGTAAVPQRPQVDDPYSQHLSDDDTVKPVIEINVPDTVQDVVSFRRVFH